MAEPVENPAVTVQAATELPSRDERSDSPPIVTDRLTKYYGGTRVVNGLNLTVQEGSVYALLGRNGAGKSTTIKMLMGLVHPDFGSATVLGEDAHRMSAETRSQIAWVGEGHPLYRWMTIDGAINFAKPFYPIWHDDLVEQVIEHFKLPRKRRLYRLSNGQRAQVSLALAVASDPKLLILDDPTIGLDTVVRRDFLESMIQIIQQEGRTILFSSHILSDVDRVADHIGIMLDGVLRVDAPTERFRDALRKVVVELSTPLAKPPDCPGLASWAQIGNRLELVFVDFGETHQAYVDSLSPTTQDILELNLEDAFVEYTRGSRGVMPAFAKEVAHV
ncbi:MAG: ABC transporter ATP-binding protein [Rhodopirellula sp.]|nr:ABC transporter ATP-binding protein [Rhodopirellula sp.]